MLAPIPNANYSFSITEKQTHRPCPIQQGALALMSTKAAAGKFIRKETIWWNLGTFIKNFGMRTDV